MITLDIKISCVCSSKQGSLSFFKFVCEKYNIKSTHSFHMKDFLMISLSNLTHLLDISVIFLFPLFS